DDADPGDAEGTLDRDYAAGARGAVLGAAGDDHGHPRRHFRLGIAAPLRRRPRPDGVRGVPGGAGAARRSLGLHPRVAAGAAATHKEPVDEDAPARALVSRRSGAAVPDRHRAVVRTRSAWSPDGVV